MAVTFKGLARLLAQALGLILPLVTRSIREELVEFIQKKYTAAVATDNPWDDYLYEFLATALRIDLPEIPE